MRLRILTRPIGTIDGIPLDEYRVGAVYDLGAGLASVFLAERWADLVSDDDVAVFADSGDIRPIEPLVLVVDDEPELRRFAESILTSQGYHVSLARHGKEAMDQLCACRPDLIVLDLNMPVMNGWQFRIEQIVLMDERCAAVPVLLMTGVDDAADHVETLRAVGVVTKPFNPDDLLQAVSVAIRSQRPGE